MRTVLVIGIGAGDPDYLTMQAVKALNRVDVFFVIDKGVAKDDLAGLRREILDRYVESPTYRVASARDPERDRCAADYAAAVTGWQRERELIYQRMISDELGERETGAFLVWGDPSLYDGTLRILDRIAERGEVTFDRAVIPGISSVSALAARHEIPLNRVGRPFTVTTGRRLADGGMPADSDDLVVMLDGQDAYAGLDAEDVDIYWGAYLGTEDEVLVRGDLAERRDGLVELRAGLRRRKGWIMDTYLLRRRDPAGG